MENKTIRTKDCLKALLHFMKPYRFKLGIAILMIVLTQLSFALNPTVEGMITTSLMQDAMDIIQGVPGAHVHFEIILGIMLLLLGLYVIKTVSQLITAFFLTDAIQMTMHDLRNALQKKIQRLPVRYFDDHAFGDILSRVTNDVDALSNALQQALTRVFGAVLTFIFVITMMLMINPIMTAIALLIIPLSLIITKVVVSHSQKLFEKQQNTLGELNGTITEMYGGFNEIILYGKQQDAIQTFQDVNDKMCKASFKAQFVSSLISPLVSLCTYLAIGAVAVFGCVLVIEQKLQVGSLQAFIRYIWQINDPLSQISQLSSQVQSAFAGMHRIFGMLAEEEEPLEKTEVKEVDTMKGDVKFEHVQFGYDADLLMKDVNIDVKAGQMVAIVGPTGAGKTTLMNLLLRFYDVKGGSIKIDGVDIRDFKREDLRSLFSLVLQDTWLFHGTIYDNIRYGRLSARKDEVIEAAKMANVHHFIRTLSHGYDTELNEEANNISQGEKQLLTIARAILKDPQILILDEATSSVDTRLEKMLQSAMQRVMKNRTSFVIAHRLSTIKNADLILVLQHGDIVEQGTHESLLEKQGIYEKLYHSQFAQQEE
ncbi:MULTISPECIES: ABC transporter ATP-binding protein [Faecalicoccus]|uniref:ABC transporter ATP-binding protein n=1 Tax=Faecalicoccus pleomorphus TaxID=1323 RepID=A0AAW6CTA9_9FIRM|nr:MULTISPECIES: ABC transporter ATP-binding protein [Faecalicoccus]MDB7980232.1 ABC transporter ATP-binding protein [Faecalicoccus pleomorphus]MDB7982566.1 ABC transporter ATP-binding protein [Faecalicoccus pleomorphus]